MSSIKSALHESERIVLDLKHQLNLSSESIIRLNKQIKDIADNEVSN